MVFYLSIIDHSSREKCGFVLFDLRVVPQMINLTCPKCHQKLRVPKAKVPEAGAWAKCPKCQERFFINPAASSPQDLARPIPRAAQPTAAGLGPRGRDQRSQNLLDHLKAKQGRLDEADYQGGLITVYPRAVVPDFVYQAVSAILLCLPLVAIFMVFSSSGDRLGSVEPRPEPVTTAVERLNDQENPVLIQRDLVSIKRDHLMRRRSLYGVGYSGSEARVFKYFMHRLAPDYCAEIRYLQVSVPNPVEAGFSATALCLEPEGRRLVMRVDWLDASHSRVSFPYNGRTEDFTIRDESDPLVRPHP